MEKRKFLRLRLKIRLSCSDLHYIFHILNSIGGPLGPMVQTSPSAQSDRSRTIKKIIKPVWTNGPLDRSGPVVLSLGADHRAPCLRPGRWTSSPRLHPGNTREGERRKKLLETQSQFHRTPLAEALASTMPAVRKPSCGQEAILKPGCHLAINDVHRNTLLAKGS